MGEPFCGIGLLGSFGLIACLLPYLVVALFELLDSVAELPVYLARLMVLEDVLLILWARVLKVHGPMATIDLIHY